MHLLCEFARLAYGLGDMYMTHWLRACVTCKCRVVRDFHICICSVSSRDWRMALVTCTWLVDSVRSWQVNHLYMINHMYMSSWGMYYSVLLCEFAVSLRGGLTRTWLIDLMCAWHGDTSIPCSSWAMYSHMFINNKYARVLCELVRWDGLIRLTHRVCQKRPIYIKRDLCISQETYWWGEMVSFTLWRVSISLWRVDSSSWDWRRWHAQPIAFGVSFLHFRFSIAIDLLVL